MKSEEIMEIIYKNGRTLEPATPGDPLLGPLQNLPGVWKNKWTPEESAAPTLEGRGWNMIALPFLSVEEGRSPDYRVLMNQYNEELKFSVVDKGVPNRGVSKEDRENINQKIVTLDYEQRITQMAAEDMPRSANVSSPLNPEGDMAGGVCPDASGQACPVIHHEPGLWLNMINMLTNDLDIARMGTIPHGDSVMALGQSDQDRAGGPQIPDVDVLPIGTGPAGDIDGGYLAPYKHFRDNPFQGLFNVLEPHTLLRAATPANVLKTTTLTVNTTIETTDTNVSGGIVNIPFIVKHANASEMSSTFWVLELDEDDGTGNPVFIMQYMQVVMLDFFDRFDNEPGRIKWPHASFNTMRRFPLPS